MRPAGEEIWWMPALLWYVSAGLVLRPTAYSVAFGTGLKVTTGCPLAVETCSPVGAPGGLLQAKRAARIKESDLRRTAGPYVRFRGARNALSSCPSAAMRSLKRDG